MSEAGPDQELIRVATPAEGRPSLRILEPAFMVHPLTAYEPWMTGTLVYADPFWRLDC